MVDVIYIRKGQRTPKERSLVLELVPRIGVLRLTTRWRKGAKVSATQDVFEQALMDLIAEARARNIKSIFVEGAWE